jgi:hypothetical protein
VGVSEKELISIAIISMGLDELAPFKPEEKIIEYMLQDKNDSRMAGMPLNDFADETASESLHRVVVLLLLILVRWVYHWHDGCELIITQKRLG